MIPPKTARRTVACCHTPVIADRPAATHRDTVARFISERRRMGTKQNHCGAAMVHETAFRVSRKTRFNPLMWKENMSAGIDPLRRLSASIWGTGGAWMKQRERDVDDCPLQTAAWRGAPDTLSGTDPTMEHPVMQLIPGARDERHRAC